MNDVVEVTSEEFSKNPTDLIGSGKTFRVKSASGELIMTIGPPVKLPEDLRIDELERQNKSLKSQIETLEQELEQSEKTIAQLDEHIEFLQLENEDLHRQIDRR